MSDLIKPVFPASNHLTRRTFMATGTALAALGVAPALAQRIRIDPDSFQPLPIAIPNFVPGSPADAQVGADVAGVITNNLRRSGLFAPIDQAAFIAQYVNPSASVTGVPSLTPDLVSFMDQYVAGLSVDTGLVKDKLSVDLTQTPLPAEPIDVSTGRVTVEGDIVQAELQTDGSM